jgi:hypothetical protein
MGTLEQKIKSFVKDQGVEVVGVAGPDRIGLMGLRLWTRPILCGGRGP